MCYLLRNFLNWGVLKEFQHKGIYGKGNQYIISEPKLIFLMTEASLLARQNRSADIKALLDSPSIFPFRLAHVLAEYVASFSPRLETLRHGLDANLVTLRK